MSHHEGTVGNADRWRVTFVDSANAPVAPDGEVTWYVNGATVATQALVSAVSTGVFEFLYTPTTARPYTVKASAEIDGVPQATNAERRRVRP